MATTASATLAITVASLPGPSRSAKRASHALSLATCTRSCSAASIAAAVGAGPPCCPGAPGSAEPTASMAAGAHRELNTCIKAHNPARTKSKAMLSGWWHPKCRKCQSLTLTEVVRQMYLHLQCTATLANRKAHTSPRMSKRCSSGRHRAAAQPAEPAGAAGSVWRACTSAALTGGCGSPGSPPATPPLAPTSHRGTPAPNHNPASAPTFGAAVHILHLLFSTTNNASLASPLRRPTKTTCETRWHLRSGLQPFSIYLENLSGNKQMHAPTVPGSRRGSMHPA